MTYIRRLIYRKIRFDKFCNLFDAEFLPDLLIRHDLCLLQEAADAIIDNGRLRKTSATIQIKMCLNP